jgi:hypothetical protein
MNFSHFELFLLITLILLIIYIFYNSYCNKEKFMNAEQYNELINNIHIAKQQNESKSITPCGY